MTNFRRALLALITFITGVGLSLGVGAGVASAHHADITGVPTCVDLKTNTYGVTWTLNPTEDRYQYSVDQAGWSPAGSNTWTNRLLVAGFPYPNSTWTKSDYPSNANATVTAGINWRDLGHTNPDYQADATGYVAKPTTPCPLTPVTPAVTYTPPTCFTAGTVVVVPGVGYTWNNDGLDPVTYTATANPGYTLTNSGVFGPYPIASIITTDECKPSYDPSVTVIETVCTEGATQVTITTTTTTYHAEFINGVWVKVADVPTVVVTYRPLLEGEIITCVPTHEPKVVTVDDGVPTCGINSISTTTTTTTYTYTYVDGVWVEHATDVVTHGSRSVVTDPCPVTTTTVTPFVTPLVPATPLPVTGRGTDGLMIGAILMGAGILAVSATRRRKVRNA